MSMKKRKTKFSQTVYGGEHQKKRSGRGARPIKAKATMHVCMKSTRAKGGWSLRTPRNLPRVEKILRTFADKHGVKLWNHAIQFNHLHLAAEFPGRKSYKAFIRAVTGAIAMAVTGMSR
jgi:hypothetical protein